MQEGRFKTASSAAETVVAVREEIDKSVETVKYLAEQSGIPVEVKNELEFIERVKVDQQRL